MREDERPANGQEIDDGFGELLLILHTFTRGLFGPANCFPPSRKPHEHFKNLPRKLYGRVTQCRTGHGFFGEYYSHMRVPENVDCACGEEYQTRSHIIRDCYLHTAARQKMTNSLTNLTDKTIFGTKEGIIALSEFIKESGAFSKGERAEPELETPP